MKKILFLLVFCASAISVQAQDMGINVFGGYTWGDDITLEYGYAHIDAAPHFGGSLEFNMPRNVSLEILYQYQSTTAQSYSGLSSDKGDVVVSYIMIGGNRYAPLKKGLEGYFGGSIGAAILIPDGNNASVGRLAWQIKAGLRIMANDMIGVKLGAQLNSPVQGIGGGLYLGTGGSGAAVSTYSSIYQFGLTGGLYYRFGGDKAHGRN